MLQHIILSTGDAALVVNNVMVMTADPAYEKPCHVESVAEKLSEALDIPLQRIERDVPTAEDWNWDGVLEETQIDAAFKTVESSVTAKSDAKPELTGEITKLNLNVAQKTCLEFYANGDFEHLAEIESQEQFTQAVKDCGNGLLTFLVFEIASSEDCDSVETALQRLERAIEDIRTVERKVLQIPDGTQWELKQELESLTVQDKPDNSSPRG